MKKLKITANERQKLQAFKNVDELNQSIRAYLYKFKKKLYNHNSLLAGKEELNAVGKVFKFLYCGSVGIVGVTFPSYKTIATKTALNVRTVRRSVAKLIDLGIIFKVNTMRLNGSDTSNTYVIKPLLKSFITDLYSVKEIPDPPTQPNLESGSFKHLKQDDIYIDSENLFKLFQWKLKDKAVKHGSTYVQKTVETLFYYAEKLLSSEDRAQQVQEILALHGNTGTNKLKNSTAWLKEGQPVKYKSTATWLY